MKFGISFTTRFMNQASALVNVYTDGTIQVSTGGTEMGQGLNTKIRQLVADEFGLAWERVLLMPTSTEKNANTSPTAASAGTDLNGAAAVDACRQIKSRLAAFAARQFASAELGLAESPENVVFENGMAFDRRNPDQRCDFGELCAAARRERVDLGAHGFYATPGVDYNRETGRGTPFLYYTQGAAVAEVEIDRFTGELTVPRVDLLDRHRPLDQSRRRSRPGDRRLHPGHGLGHGRVPGLQRPRRAVEPLADDVQDPRDHRRAARCSIASSSRTTTTSKTSPAARRSASRR